MNLYRFETQRIKKKMGIKKLENRNELTIAAKLFVDVRTQTCLCNKYKVNIVGCDVIVETEFCLYFFLLLLLLLFSLHSFIHSLRSSFVSSSLHPSANMYRINGYGWFQFDNRVQGATILFTLFLLTYMYWSIWVRWILKT